MTADAPDSRPERILLASLDRLGDLLFTLPAIDHVRACNPDADISFVTSAYAAGVLEEHPALDRVFAVDRDGNSVRRFLNWRGFLRRWGNRPPDRLVLFREGHDGRALARHFAASRIDSVRDIPEAERRILHTSALRSALAGRVCGTPVPSDAMPTLHVPPCRAEAASRRLEQLGLHADGCVALHPGVNRLVRRRGWGGSAPPPPSPKLWPLPRWIELGRALVQRGLRPVLTGSGGEAEVCSEVATRIGPEAVSLAGPLPVMEVAALYAQVRGLVVSDTGPGHLAAAAGGRVVSIFGPTDPALYAPVAPESRRRVLRQHRECGACRDPGSETAAHTCMDAVHVESVLDAAEALGIVRA
jgi:ADP-heptose:LPS heptosyltransferase